MRPEYLTVAELCQALKVSRATLYDWRRRRGFPRGVSVGPGGRLLNSWNDVETWLASLPRR